ncbi:hypothetical protein KZZ52_02185 [Dactylosporangium sp. AC04546]|nr:hypothetical protein [Dactylosporangium sp. AC04546]WVK84267.1 hypothetical protein KZZ52_02185 [Dactylosporangium sp. AC04546]
MNGSIGRSMSTILMRAMPQPMKQADPSGGVTSEMPNTARLKPAFVIGGIMVEPIAAASAFTEPDEADEPLGRAGAVQDLAGEHELRDRQQGERVQPVEHRLGRDRQRYVVGGRLDEADRAEGGHDRGAHQDERADAEEGEAEAHTATSSSSAAWPGTSAPPQQGRDLHDDVGQAERAAEGQREERRPQRDADRRDDVALFVEVDGAADADAGEHHAEHDELADAQPAPRLDADAPLEEVQGHVRVVADADGEAHERDVHQQVGGGLVRPGQWLLQRVPEGHLREDHPDRAGQQGEHEHVLGQGQRAQRAVRALEGRRGVGCVGGLHVTPPGGTSPGRRRWRGSCPAPA